MPASTRKRGIVFAIGGREARIGELDILGRFVECCGGPRTRLVVVTTASSDPKKRIDEYGAAFRSLGLDRVDFFHPLTRTDCNDPALREAVDVADAVFFTGGNQLTLVSSLAGSTLARRIQERHREGLHLGGTSAGASAMSAVMIARGKARSAARLTSLRMTAGFGILPSLIIDQHFRERDRFGRLITAVLCNPGLLGFGLDEDTAFILDPDDLVEVVGRGTLTIVDGSALEASNIDAIPEDEAAAYAGLRLHALSKGWTYDLQTTKIEAAQIDLERVADPA